MLTTTILCLLTLEYSVAYTDKPNVVIFLADDMGYADLQSYGNPLSMTPNIDKLERSGLKFTQMYSASPLCSASRAGLLTGRYPVRTGVWNTDPDGVAVFTPKSILGLPLNETTIPEMLATQGYKSAIIGKWHLGVGLSKQYLPLNQGFDHFFGLPYSHESCFCSPCFYPDIECDFDMYNASFPCPLMLENDIIEQPLDLTTLAERQVRAARSWIQEFACNETPFFLYYSSLHPHIPQFAGRRYINQTKGGKYTDSLAELDWEIGEVMDELRKNDLIKNTLVLFTSDNGPDKYSHTQGGFSGSMRCGKFCTFDGGSRVPAVASWPGHIKQGVSMELLSHLDIWPTLRRLSGTPMDYFDIILDGYDISDVLFNGVKSPRESLLYYNYMPDPETGPYAIRNNRFKALFITENIFGTDPNDLDPMCRSGNATEIHERPLIYDLLVDPEERFDIASNSALVTEMMVKLMNKESKVLFGPSVLAQVNSTVKLCCLSSCEPFPECCQCPSIYSLDLFPIQNVCREGRKE
ncbi:arylsulfatase A-like [Antedon mediterranea]|uniref:arylsulfatase A-like n=1 Tax=Antedon mediterranea TaxID=105859 RepID=UPI003AF915A8